VRSRVLETPPRCFPGGNPQRIRVIRELFTTILVVEAVPLSLAAQGEPSPRSRVGRDAARRTPAANAPKLRDGVRSKGSG